MNLKNARICTQSLPSQTFEYRISVDAFGSTEAAASVVKKLHRRKIGACIKGGELIITQDMEGENVEQAMKQLNDKIRSTVGPFDIKLL